MSLLITISRQHVIIPKYNCEFVFTPIHEKLEQSALITWHFLRLNKSSFISKKDLLYTNKLFQDYGKALFDTIFPENIREDIILDGPILLQLMHASLDEKPWELLFDGINFLNLTKGIIRVFDIALPKTTQMHIEDENEFSPKIGIFSHISAQGRKEPFQAYLRTPTIEQTLSQFNKQERECFLAHGNFNQTQLQAVSQEQLKILLFSGQSKDSFWYLDKKNKSESTSFLYPLQKATEKGLSVLLPFTEEIQLASQLPAHYKQLDIPFILSLHGFLNLSFYQLWTSSFFKSLLQTNPVLKAFRFALNQMHTKTWNGHNWTFSWFRLYANLNTIEENVNLSIYKTPIPKHQITRQPNLPLFIYKRPFHDQDRAKDLVTLLKKEDVKTIWVYSTQQDNLLAYWHETLRLLAYESSYEWTEASYKELQTEQTSLEKNMPSFFHKLSFATSSAYDLQQTIAVHAMPNSKKYTLITFFVPNGISEEQYKAFETTTKAYDKVIFFSYVTPNDTFNFNSFPILSSKNSLLGYSFPPSPTLNEFQSKLSSFNQSSAILRLGNIISSISLITLFSQQLSLSHSWEVVWSTLEKSLSKEEKQTLLTLFILQFSVPFSIFSLFTNEANSFSAIANHLYTLHLVEIDLTSKYISLSKEISFFFEQYRTFSVDEIHTQADKILIKITQQILQKKPFTNQIYILYCATLQKLKTPEYLDLFVLRTKQLLSYIPYDYQVHQIQISWFLRFSLQTVLSYNITQPIFEIVTNVLRFLFTIKSYQNDSLVLYQWLSHALEEHTQWQLLAEVHLMGASIYRNLGKVDQALHTLNATMQLNQDLQQLAIYYDTLISMTLLLLEIGELDEALSMVQDANFNMQKLSKQNISKLYFIDGFILKSQNNLESSTKAFLKSMDSYLNDIPLSLQVTAYEQIKNSPFAKQYQKAFSSYRKNLAKSYEIANQPEKAKIIYKELIKECLDQDNLQQATVYTEWLYMFFKNTNNTQELKKTTHQLGQLYFKQQKMEKAASLYAYAQTLLTE